MLEWNIRNSFLPVLRICFILILIWIRIRIRIEKIPFFYFYFYWENDLFCYLWGKYSCPLNISLLFLKKKKCDIHMILVEIFHDFGWFLLNGSGSGWPNGSGSPTMLFTKAVYWESNQDIQSDPPAQLPSSPQIKN